MPHFAPLIKEEESPSLTDGINEKDSLVDELILAMSIDEYTPESGPVDPAVQAIRESMTRKFLGKSLAGTGAIATKQNVPKDNIDIFFEGLIRANTVVTSLSSAFPLTVIPIKSIERPSGAQIFLKREAEEDVEIGNEKKVKLDDPHPTPKVEESIQMDDDDMDNLVSEIFVLPAFIKRNIY